MNPSEESTPGIYVSITDGVATVIINNPAQRNAITKTMCLQLVNAMTEVEENPDVEIVVLRGADRTFSAGVAINELPAVLLDRQENNSVVDHLTNVDRAIISVTKPILALVEGACMGGAWQIASACDFIIASESSKFGITPAKIGIIYPRLGIERLTKLVGHANAKYLLLTGETIGAAQAHSLGLVAEIVPDADFSRRTNNIVRSLGHRSRFSTHFMKRLINHSDTEHAQPDQAWEEAWAAMSESPDMEIGIQAFALGLKPEFLWKPQKPANSITAWSRGEDGAAD